MSIRTGVAAAVCLVLGAGVTAASAQQAAAGRPAGTFVKRDVYVSVQVNTDASGNNVTGDAANEPSIAVSPVAPKRIAIGWRQFDSVASSFRQAGRAWSADGGKSWTNPGPLSPGVTFTDPVLSYDASGRFYYLGVTNQGGTLHCELWRSSNGGVSWAAPKYALGGDKPWMAVDRTGGAGNGNLYLVWDGGAGCCGPSSFARSTDVGQTFTLHSLFGTPPILGTLDVATDGRVYVTGVDPNNLGKFLLTWSDDAQNPAATPTFSPPLVVDMRGVFTLKVPGPNPTGLYGQVWVATSPTDASTLYMLSSLDPFTSDPMDVHFTRSTDGGQSWSLPKRVNDDPLGNGAWQWFGTLSVAPNGRIDVVWHDTRNSGGLSNLSETYYAFSTDGGLTFAPNVAVTPQWNSHLGWPIANKIGDYIHTVSTDDAVHVAYAATFNGEQDVYYLRIPH